MVCVCCCCDDQDDHDHLLHHHNDKVAKIIMDDDDDDDGTITISTTRSTIMRSTSSNSNRRRIVLMMNEVVWMNLIWILLLLVVVVIAIIIRTTTTTTKTTTTTLSSLSVYNNNNNNNTIAKVDENHNTTNQYYHQLYPYKQIIETVRLQQQQLKEEDEGDEELYTNNSTTTTISNISSSSILHHHHHNHHSPHKQQQQPLLHEHLHEQKRQRYDHHYYRHLKSLIHPKLGTTLTNLINTYNNENQNNNQNNVVVVESNNTSTNSSNNGSSSSSSSSSTTSDSKRYMNPNSITIINTNQILVDVVIHMNSLLDRIMIMNRSMKTTTTTTNTTKTSRSNTNTTSTNHHQHQNNDTKLSLSTALQLDGFTVNNDAIDNDTTTDTSDDGSSITVINCYVSLCSMYISMDIVYNLVELEYIQSIRPVMVQTNSGSIQTEGDIALYTNIVRDKYDVDGTDIIIGIISDSFDCKNGASNDIINGNIPSNPNLIKILKDLDRNNECNQYQAKDEGRAMMQILHDIAPNAKLVFRTGVRGKADFISGIMELVNTENCTIVLDDIQFIDEPFFQDGIITQTIDTIVQNQNVIYFTSIGNSGSRNVWNADAFINSTIRDEFGDYHQYDQARDMSPVIVQGVVLPNIDQDFIFVLQWDEPFVDISTGKGGSRTDVDLFFEMNGFIVASSIEYNKGKNPIESVMINPRRLSSDKFEYVFIGMLIQLFEGEPKPGPMKVVVYTNNQIENNVIFEYGIAGSSTCVGHCNSAFVASVGAASYLQTPAFGVTPPIIQPYSSFGGTPIIFDKNSNRLSQQVIRQQPRLVGPDGTLISFSLNDDTSNNRFYGTSAAVAHVAGVAALLVQGLRKSSSTSSSLLPNDIYKLLQDTAIDMDNNATKGVFDIGFDFNTGFGFVNAMELFETANIVTPSCNIGCRFRCFISRFGIGNAVCF